MTGIADDAPADNDHIIRSEDGKCAIWLGAVDDLWKLGKPTGNGGPWKDSPVKANTPSDAYIMTGYDNKAMTLSHRDNETVTIKVQVDIDGNQNWQTIRTIDIPTGRTTTFKFPPAFNAYWVRCIASKDTIATAQLAYD